MKKHEGKQVSIWARDGVLSIVKARNNTMP